MMACLPFVLYHFDQLSENSPLFDLVDRPVQTHCPSQPYPMKKSPEDKALIVSKKKWLEDALDAFSENHLDHDYFDLTCDVVDRMARKRQVPFLTGRLEIWICIRFHYSCHWKVQLLI